MKPLKDKKITIYAEITDENGTGYTEIKYRPIHPGTVWAYMRDMSAREYYAAGRVEYESDKAEAHYYERLRVHEEVCY